MKSPSKFRVLASLVAIAMAPGAAWGAITWDGQAGTQYWFNPINWNVASNSNTVLPPSGDAAGTGATDTQINIGTTGLPGGEGVVYDPSNNDPGYQNVGSIPFPTDFGPKIIRELYISRGTTAENMLTIKGDLQTANIQVGRSSTSLETPANGSIVQKGGLLKVIGGTLDIAQTDTSAANVGYGNGTYDYQGGSMEVQLGGTNNSGMRLAPGTNTGARGPGGTGRFIMHNPSTPGYVRVANVQSAAFAGSANGIYDPGNDPDGITRGVGIFEFHVENGATRPMQIEIGISLNNGLDTTTGGTRSSRLQLVLGSAPGVTGNVPNNLGLFDIDFNQTDFFVGLVQGTGTKGGTFDMIDGSTNLPEGAAISAIHANKLYTWKISYHGIISWTNPDTGTLASVTPGALGVDSDIVLIGDSVTQLDPDFNNNGFVDGADFLIWQRNTGGPGTPATGDADGNAVVNDVDYSIWKGAYGSAFPAEPSFASVPEPASAALLGVTTLALIAVRRRAA